jgi:hypothetical protein
MKKLYLLIVCFLTLQLAIAQIDDPPGDFIDEDPELPVDGALGLLLAAGVGYGIKKLTKNK